MKVVCREILRTMNALLSESQLSGKCWPPVIPLVQSDLNNAAQRSVGNRCPLTLFTALNQDTPLFSVKKDVDGNIKVKNIDETRFRPLKEITDLGKPR